MLGCDGKGTAGKHNHQDDDGDFLSDMGEMLLQRVRTYQGFILVIIPPLL